MASPKGRVETADREAAAWHVRLGEPRVTSQTMEAFFAWRRKPGNADAYRRVETAWSGAGALRADPALIQAAEAAMSRRRARPAGRTALGFAAAGAAIVAVAVALLWQQSVPAYATDVGEARVVQLADGSTVRLDTASRVKVRFTGDRRLVELEGGQALFEVAHDPARPFIVDAGEATVTALGTVFDVRRDGTSVRVTLVSGVVEVASGRGQEPVKRLAAGQVARVTTAGTATAPADVAMETSWTDGRIVFRDTPLAAAVDEVNRYLVDKIELQADGKGDAAVNGVFRTGDRDAFVSTTSAVFGLQAVKRPDGGVLLRERTK